MENEMDFTVTDRFYVSPSLRLKKNRILRRLRKQKHFKKLYVLTVPSEAGFQLEIMDANYLCQDYYRAYPPIIAGIASDYEEAVEILKIIAVKAYSSDDGAGANGRICRFLRI